MISTVFSPFTLPCGAQLPNRLSKVAMGGDVLSPSTTPLDLGTHSHLFDMGKSKQPKANVSAIFSLIRDRIRLKKLTKRYQQYLAKQLG